MSQIMMYGGPPSPGTGTRPWPWENPGTVPQPQKVFIHDENVARELRELREMIAALKAGQGESDAIAVVKKMCKALIESHPDALAAVEAVCAEARKAKKRKRRSAADGRPGDTSTLNNPGDD